VAPSCHGARTVSIRGHNTNSPISGLSEFHSYLYLRLEFGKSAGIWEKNCKKAEKTA
jgi:hypothetical protein